MAILNLEFYTQKDFYSDGDIEDSMLQMVRDGKSFEEMDPKEVTFPVLYHFSDVRRNILCWYSIGKTETVLEIGAGCGAITGMLCEKAGKVVSVELSKRRADINYERNQDKDNLTIMVGNLNDMSFDEKFDYVVVNGVLEYAMGFTGGDKPYETFLQNMCGYLKNTGKILIAIENKLGLKYFAGAPEDHTDLYFYGINNYPENHSVRTFSKNELSELLRNSGLPYYKYYYPFPDYKFPTEIFTDETLYENGYGERSYPLYTDKNIQFFSEEECVSDLVKEKVLDRFVNSFLVVAGKEKLEEKKKILYVKLNQERRKKFRLMTLLVEENGTRKAEKHAMNQEAVPTLKNFIKLGQLGGTGLYRNLPSNYENQTVSYPFLDGTTLNQKIKKWVEDKNVEKVIQALRQLYESVFKERKTVDNYQTEAFVHVFGDYPGKEYYECVQPANVDLICSNIIEQGSEYKIIDYEWVFPFPVPVPFIMWRLIHELYTKVPDLSPIFPEESMREEFGIGYSDCEIFMHWTMHFVYEYVGSDSLSVYQKPKLHLPLNELVTQELSKEYADTKLYYDLGQGLNEQDVIAQRLYLEQGRFEAVFDLSGLKGIRGLRWNLYVGKFCELKINNIDCNCRIRLLSWDPKVDVNEDVTWFLTTEVTYFIDAWKHSDIREIKIQGSIRYLDMNETGRIIADQHEQKRQEKERQEKEKQEKEKQNNSVIVEEKTQQEIQQEESLQAAVPVSKKQRAKQLIKKILGYKEPVPEQPPVETPVVRTACVGNVDFFSYENEAVNIIGWAYDTLYPMKKARIAFYHGEEKVEETGFSVVYREDVAEVLKVPDAKSSGFSFEAIVQSPVDLDMFLEYDTEVETGRFHIGSIPGDRAKNEIEIFPVTSSNSIGYITHFCSRRVIPGKITEPMPVSSQTIDIIVPIYNGMQYFDSLFDSIERTKMNYRLILIDDKSPDAQVAEYLERYAASHSNVILLRNEENLGFVRSVNRALKMAENNVALVNTDVEVPEEWLERLMEPILSGEKVATSTPFTTCGTICSFPDFCKDNEIFEGLPIWKIDDVFRRIKPQYPVLPTGIGFCMGMSIEAIREIGVLDAETFGKGYGEENDWCRRAIKAGYKNVQVDNLFVYHKHGGSFPSEEKQKLLEHNLKELEKKHPDYNRNTAAFCRRDPAREVRLYVMLKLLEQNMDAPTIVAFDHNLGGGATEYLLEKKKQYIKAGNRFLTIRYDIYEGKYWLSYEYKKYVIEYWTRDIHEVFQHIQKIDEIWINELVTYSDLYDTLDYITAMKEKYHAYLKMLLHDFFSVCPAINMMDDRGKYCEGALAERCDKCIPLNRSNACLDYESGTVWRKNWKKFLQGCDEILAFSDDTARLFKQVYPDVYRVKVIPHKPHYVLPLRKCAKTTATFNIGLLGVLCYKKGLEVVKELVTYIEKEQLNVRIKLIGVSDEEIDSPVFSCTGRYTKGQLPWLTMQEDIDMFLIPSIWPETFSYTTSEIISMNMPVAVFPIGAPVERVVHYNKGLVISKTDPKTILTEMTAFAKDVLHYEDMPVHEKKILFIGEEISFASRYRVEHFREQLFFRGYGSDFIQMEDIDNTDLPEYCAVVFYRCSNTEKMKTFVPKIRKYELPVYYDIDDFIFNYAEISYLHFLKGSEYTDFKNTTERIHACMDLCDGYFTSTKTLAKEIQREFPEKTVTINRNCASMEMQMLSHDAVEQVEKDRDRIYIGYFSGSKTHDQDFEIVENAIIRIMKKYSNVYLKLVGVLSEDKIKHMQNRVEKLPFMEWQKLPEVLAGIDINLMPLEDSVFHWCKSENKWMEAALVKVPSIMTRNKEMEHVVKDRVTACLCSTEEEWYEALVLLIEDAKKRNEMGENAHNVVMERYITQNTGKDAREELLCSVNFSK